MTRIFDFTPCFLLLIGRGWRYILKWNGNVQTYVEVYPMYNWIIKLYKIYFSWKSVTMLHGWTKITGWTRLAKRPFCYMNKWRWEKNVKRLNDWGKIVFFVKEEEEFVRDRSAMPPSYLSKLVILLELIYYFTYFSPSSHPTLCASFL